LRTGSEVKVDGGLRLHLDFVDIPPFALLLSIYTVLPTSFLLCFSPVSPPASHSNHRSIDCSSWPQPNPTGQPLPSHRKKPTPCTTLFFTHTETELTEAVPRSISATNRCYAYLRAVKSHLRVCARRLGQLRAFECLLAVQVVDHAPDHFTPSLYECARAYHESPQDCHHTSLIIY
jgi:hypothetical protein